MNAHEVKPVRLIQSLCAVCGSNLAGLTLLYIVLPCVAAVVPPCVADVSIVNARYVSNLINEHYYYCYYYKQPLNEVVEALAPNILVQFRSLLHRGTSFHNTLSNSVRFV